MFLRTVQSSIIVHGYYKTLLSVTFCYICIVSYSKSR